jgi:hypothetical protein
MKPQILPMFFIVLLSAPPVDAEAQQQSAVPTTTYSEELQVQEPTVQTETRSEGASRFELRQERRIVEDGSVRTKDEIPTVQTSPEAATLSDTAQLISIRETPDPVRKHIERQAAFVPLQSIIRQTQDDKTVYEANFLGLKVASKLLLSEEGVPLNLHVRSTAPVMYDAAGAQRPAQEPPATPAEPSQISQQAVNRLQQQIGNAEIRSVQPRTIYDVTIEANGQAQQVWVSEDGSIIR